MSALAELTQSRARPRFSDLAARFAEDERLMVVATADEQALGAALAFPNGTRTATLRAIAVVDTLRHRGIGRLLVERVETEAGLLGVECIALGTDEAVGFWYRLGYTPKLLLQWVYDAEACNKSPKRSWMDRWPACVTGVRRITTYPSSTSNSMSQGLTCATGCGRCPGVMLASCWQSSRLRRGA